MDPASPGAAAALLRAAGIRPRKRWGQNFLVDRNTRQKIVQAALLQPEDRTLEIGPGLGALTRALAESSSHVTAVELDRLLAPVLQQTLSGLTNVRILYADFLKLELSSLLGEAFGDAPGVVVANIPYYISSPIVESLLAEKQRIRRIVLLVQEEFARRLAAAPGTADYGALSVFAQYHARVEVVGRVPRSVFYPPPEVASAIVRLTPVLPGAVRVRDEALFFRVTRAAFGQRRKTISNALSGGLPDFSREQLLAALVRAGIDPARRGETLSLEEFANLADAVAQSGGSGNPQGADSG